MKIDLVYNYVNGNDEDWITRRNQYAKDENNGVCRFRDNGELKYSLRSVERYAPWINHVYIIMDSKVPDWLDTACDKISIVRHEEIMPAKLLPCYNSTVIESCLTNIRGLSEYFIYANDDMMFGNETEPDFFFKDGKPVVRLVERKKELDAYYNSLIAGAGDLMKSRYGRAYRAYSYHNMDAYIKSGIDWCRDIFGEEFRKAETNRLRGKGDIHRILFQYFYLEHNLGQLKLYHRNTKLEKLVEYMKIVIRPDRYFDFFVCDMHALCSSRFKKFVFGLKPRVFCINDSDDVNERDCDEIQALMQRMFPQKSSFEKQ